MLNRKWRRFLEGELDVDRQKSNALHADVLRRGPENPGRSQNLDRSKDEVANSQAVLSPQSMREMKDISQELDWMQMEENQFESAALDSGGMGTDDIGRG